MEAAAELSDMRKLNLKPAMGRTHNVTESTVTKVHELMPPVTSENGAGRLKLGG